MAGGMSEGDVGFSVMKKGDLGAFSFLGEQGLERWLIETEGLSAALLFLKAKA